MSPTVPGNHGNSYGITVITGTDAGETASWLERTADEHGGDNRHAFADTRTPLLSIFDVRMNVMLPRLYHLKASKPEARRMADALLDRAGFDGARDATPARLSALETVQALIARALALDPSRVFINEPFQMETVAAWYRIEKCLVSLARDRRLAVFVATHNLAFAAACADRMVYVREGEAEVYESWPMFAAANGPAAFIRALPFAVETRTP